MSKQSFFFAGIILLAFGVIGPAPAIANVGPPPERPKPREDPEKKTVDVVLTWVVVKVDPKATKSVLQIPVGQMPRRVGANEPPAGPGVARSVIAAFALSLAIFGAFFVRRTRRARAIVSAVVCCAAVVTAGALVAHEPPAEKNEPPKQIEDSSPHSAADTPQSPSAASAANNAGSFTLVVDGKPRLFDIQEMAAGDRVTLILAGNDGGLIAPAGKAAETTPEPRAATSGAAKAK